MSDSYRSWGEREAAAELTRAQALKTKTEADVAKQGVESAKAKAGTDLLAEQVKQAGLKRKLDAVQRDTKADESEAKAARREASADSGMHFKMLVNVVMALGLLAALPAQLVYFLDLHRNGDTSGGHAWLLGPIPFFLELLAWVGVLGTQWAHRKGLPRWPFWILTAALASVAGYINLSHGTQQYGLVAGLALAATSMIGPMLAEVRQVLESRAAADSRNLEQRAKDKAAAKRAAEESAKEAKRAAEEDAERERVFAEEFKEYRRIMIAHPAGAISRDEAWERAWDNLHRLPLGMTAGTLAARVAAQYGIDSVLSGAERTPESVTVDLLLADVFNPSRGDGGTAGGTRGGSRQGGPRGTGGGSSVAVADRPSEGRTPLGRKGKQPSGRATSKTPEKPLDPAHIETVRKLAELSGGAEKLSARKVREVIGGGSNEYAVRLRNHIQNENH